ncbi:MAG: hypothetical protein IJE21_07735 [Alistipes sp.]|nr:hypothetical protein [Alistipes sp.]
MCRKIFILVIVLLMSLPTSAQVLFFDGEVATLFDNTEHSGSDVGHSRTLFAVRLTPTIGYRWAGRHSVVAGAELRKDFGSKRFLDHAQLVAYYEFRYKQYGANAGIFSRDKLIGDYSRAIYSDSTRFVSSQVQGVAMHYRSERAFAELAVDWEGLYSPEVREKFRILVAAGGSFAKHFYAGGAFSMLHFANRSTIHGNVVDNILINPYIGARFTAFFNFDLRLGGLLTMQRDRMQHAGWKMPMGGEFRFRMEKWGVFIENNLYVGESLTPFYNTIGKDGEPYGNGLYAGDPFYGTTHKVYNRTGIGYERSFWKDNVKVRAEMVLQLNGKRMYCQQLVGVSAAICPTIYDKQNHKKAKR